MTTMTTPKRKNTLAAAAVAVAVAVAVAAVAVAVVAVASVVSLPHDRNHLRHVIPSSSPTHCVREPPKASPLSTTPALGGTWMCASGCFSTEACAAKSTHFLLLLLSRILHP
jgi:hypothetical protein